MKTITVEQRFALLAAMGANIDWKQFTPDQIQSFINDPGSMQTTAFLKARARMQSVGKHIIDMDAPSKRAHQQWEVGEDQLPHVVHGQVEWDAAKTALYFSKQQTADKGYIGGPDLRKELENQKVYTDQVVDFYLDHPEVPIPKEWLGKWIFCWGRIYCDSGGHLFVRCLFCGWGGSRGGHYYDLGDDFRFNYPALVVAGK